MPGYVTMRIKIVMSRKITMSANLETVRFHILLISAMTQLDEKPISTHFIEGIDPDGVSQKADQFKYRFFDEARLIHWYDGGIPFHFTISVKSFYPGSYKGPLQNMVVFLFALNDRSTFEESKSKYITAQATLMSIPSILVGIKYSNESTALSIEAQEFVRENNLKYREVNPLTHEGVSELKKEIQRLAKKSMPRVEYPEEHNTRPMLCPLL